MAPWNTEKFVYFILISYTYASCRFGFEEWSGTCIQLHKNVVTSVVAEKQCKQNDSTLLELTDEKALLSELNKFLKLHNINEAWLGGKKQKTWYWSEDGETTPKDASSLITKKFWGAGEPNEHAGAKEDRICLTSVLHLLWNDESAGATDYGPVADFKALCSCSVCQDGKISTLWKFYHSNITHFVPNRVRIPWTEAVHECRQHGSKLIKIESQELQEELMKVLPRPANYWTAGYWDGNYKVTWNNGKEIAYDQKLIGGDSFCVSAEQETSVNARLRLFSCNSPLKAFICQSSHTDGQMWEKQPLQTTTTDAHTGPSVNSLSRIITAHSDLVTTIPDAGVSFSQESTPKVTTPAHTSPSEVTVHFHSTLHKVSTTSHTAPPEVITPTPIFLSEVTNSTHPNLPDITTPAHTSHSDRTQSTYTSFPEVTPPAHSSLPNITMHTYTHLPDTTLSAYTSIPEATKPADTSIPDVKTSADTSLAEVTESAHASVTAVITNKTTVTGTEHEVVTGTSPPSVISRIVEKLSCVESINCTPLIIILGILGMTGFILIFVGLFCKRSAKRRQKRCPVQPSHTTSF